MVLLLLDFPGAFDTVDHDITCCRLERLLEFRGKPLAWLQCVCFLLFHRVRSWSLHCLSHTSSPTVSNDFAFFVKCETDKIQAQLLEVTIGVVFPLPICFFSSSYFDLVTVDEVQSIFTKLQTKRNDLDPTLSLMV